MENCSSAPGVVGLQDVIRALRDRVAAWGGRGVLATVLVLLVWRRLGEIGRRMERMQARFRAGVVLRRGVAVRGDQLCAVEAGAVDPIAACGMPDAGRRVRRGSGRRVWPGRFGWLVRACGYEAAGLSEQLRFVLAQPEMVALLKAAPQAVAVLRPLCRALAIETDVLRPGVVRVPAAEKPPRPVRVRKPRPKIDFGRIPLPRGLLSAARRQGFGKIR